MSETSPSFKSIRSEVLEFLSSFLSSFKSPSTLNFYMMVTTEGANSHFFSDEDVVAHDSVSFIDAGVETLIVDFDQAAYEKFLQGSAGLVKPAHSFRRI